MGIPIDVSGQLIPLGPSSTALAVTYDTSISSATSIALNAAARFIRVTAIGEGVFLRWSGTVSSVNFDEYIEAGQTLDWQIEPSQAGTTISVIERAASASVVVIQKA
jgi:hypothetical protein